MPLHTKSVTKETEVLLWLKLGSPDMEGKIRSMSSANDRNENSNHIFDLTYLNTQCGILFISAQSDIV